MPDFLTRWSQSSIPIADAATLRAQVDGSPGKPPQNIVGPPAPDISEVSLYSDPLDETRAYVGVATNWAIGEVNTIMPGLPFGAPGVIPW